MDLLKDKEKLEDLYINKNLSAQKVADIVGVDKSTVCRALKKLKIPLRKRTSKYPKLNDKVWLQTEYQKGRSIKNIAEELGCAVGVVASSLYSLGVKTRSPKEAWNKRFPEGRLGATHPNWAGGVSVISKRIRGLKLFSDWRQKILTRDQKRCVLCGSKKRIEVDHIIQLAYFIRKYSIKTSEEASKIEELWDISNGRVLCHECHLKSDTHSRRLPKN